MLETNGFGIVWLSQGVGNEKHFLSQMKTRLIDCFKQGWNEKMRLSEHCNTFYSFKSFITPELFLNDSSFGRSLRNVLIKFRLGVSKLNCHRYKFYKNKELLNCPFCINKLENEFHVLFECGSYSSIRSILPQNIIVAHNEASMYRLLSENFYHKCTAIYLLQMFKLRDTLICRE